MMSAKLMLTLEVVVAPNATTCFAVGPISVLTMLAFLISVNRYVMVEGHAVIVPKKTATMLST